jgi:hypothetical protein
MNYLIKAEYNDEFIKKCTNSHNNKLARKYNKYVTDFNSYYKIIEDFVKKNSIFSSVQIVQLDPSAENGYPHTRPGIICIPSSAKFPELEQTLYHEYVHIHQRKNFELWKQFLEKKEWTPVDESEIPEQWKERVRYNPDTIYSQYWCFKKRYVPLPIYINLNSPTMYDIKVMYYDLESGNLDNDMPDIMKRYNSNRQTEHPFELYAVEMENIIRNDKDILDYMNRWTY